VTLATSQVRVTLRDGALPEGGGGDGMAAKAPGLHLRVHTWVARQGRVQPAGPGPGWDAEVRVAGAAPPLLASAGVDVVGL
jgi:hypothetical protein